MRHLKPGLLILILFTVAGTKSQVGIGIATPNASAILDLTSTNKGLLIPRVALTATNSISPFGSTVTSLLVYNTASASSGSTAVTPGYYYRNGAWVRLNENGWISATSATTTNYTASTRFLGTASNNHIDLVTNGIVRGRLSSFGQFYIGATSTTRSTDLMGSVGNSSFPWAINGYSNFNGSGVYGAITGGTTQFPGIMGEYSGTGAFNTAAIKGINRNALEGTSFAIDASTGPRMGIFGTTASLTGSYTFGLYGSFATNETRSGGVMGVVPDGSVLGSLGYCASNTIWYGVYGFGKLYQQGTSDGRGASPNTSFQSLDTNTNIGIGIYGGMMGGWVRGLKYGFNTKGETYSMYIDGKGYTNEPLAYLAPTATDERVAS